MTTSTYCVDSLVIGSCLRSITWCAKNNSVLLFNNKLKPKFFEDDYQAWNEGIFKLSLAGLVPFGESIKSIRINNNLASISYGSNLSKKIQFKTCFVFDDMLLSVDNNIVDKKVNKLKVFDWMNLKKCEQSNLNEIITNDNFVNKIIPYKSGRLDSNLHHMDLVVVSYLTLKQLSTFDFSDTICKFKTRDILEKHGIQGTINRTEKLTGKQFRNRIDLTVIEREVVCTDKNIYESSEHIKFL